jgi:hypothetical protein
VLQGNCSEHSHTGHEAYAYDFRMPIGSYIFAMRAAKIFSMAV